MKIINPIYVLLISISFLLQGCDIENNQQKTKDFEVSAIIKPRKVYLNMDSLKIRVPGENGIKLPEKFSSNLPKDIEYIGVSEIVPGISYHPQTLDEKLARKEPVKSKKPEIIKVDFTKLKKYDLVENKLPIITNVDKEILLPLDSIFDYKNIILKRGLVSIQHEDSIFPPLGYNSGYPNRSRALPFRYMDETVFDISTLEVDQGLTNPFVRAIAKDRNGVLWLATHNGPLISYDGEFFDEYKMNNSPQRVLTYSLLIDKKGSIWKGTDNGVTRFDGKIITRFTIKQGLPTNNVVAMIEDSKGNLWFGTDKGVSMFDGETFYTYSTINESGEDYIYSLFEDNKGDIWFGTYGGGVTKFDGKTFITYTENDGLASNIVLSITQDHIGNLWFGTNGAGVSKFDGKTFTNYSIEQGLNGNVILSIVEDANNNIWFGSFGNGISFFNGNSFFTYTSKEGLGDNYIRTLFEDGSGNILLGTDAGVTKIRTSSFKHYTKSQGLIKNNITAVYEDNNGRIWFANFENGVSILNEPIQPEQKVTFTNINSDQGLTHNIVTSIIQDDQNNYWFGTYGGGLSKLDGKSFENGKLKFTNYTIEQGTNSKLVNDLIIDKNGDIWIMTNRGATKFDGKQFVTISKANGLGANSVLCVFQDNADALWFGTIDGGVSCLFNDTLTQYTTDQGLGNNRVTAICQDNNGVMWFGTDGGGLSYFNGQTFKTLNINDGLSSDNVFSLIVDPNNSLWIGTIKGLCQINLQISSDLSKIDYDSLFIINYGKMDGLKGQDFYARASMIDKNNLIWLGTERAITMLDLSSFKSTKEQPHIHMNGVSINNHILDFNKLKLKDNITHSEIHFSDVSKFYNNPINLSLPHDKNHLTFNFSAIDWSAPHQIKYQYKLQGIEEDWSLLSKVNMADYRNISPGHYTFLVKAIGKSGIWSEEFEYPFTIRWPWWLSWWAIFVYVIAFMLGIWVIIRWRVNIIKRQKLILENMVARRTKDLDEALLLAEQATNAKSQFIATMSHEIRTPLNAIMGLTHLAIGNASNSKQEDYLQKIDRSANTMLSLINDILDFSKIEVGKMQLENVPFDIEIVMNSVIILNAQHAREKDLEFIINIDPKIPKVLMGDPLRIGQVITNFCSNAIKFTSSGEIVINVEVIKKLSEKELILQVTVKDTGIGIEKDQIPFLFDEFEQADNSITRKFGGTGLGLSISRLLIDLMGGRIWLDSEPGKGTSFYFDCKIGIQEKESSLKKLKLDDLKLVNVLICDDNSSALNSLEIVLKSFLLNVDSVRSGEEVLKQITEKQYGLLIIDQKLGGGLTGVGTITEINNMPGLEMIKSILMTNSESGAKDYENEVGGINGHLSKPIVPSVVFEELLTVFGFEKSTSQQKDDKEEQLLQIKKAISHCSILIVEDNELNRQVIIELVDKVGVNIDIADNGKTAVNKALEKKYDLIFMDLHMPIMDGYNAAKLIRKQNALVPIVAITADTIDDIKVKCKQAGIDDIITKPIDPDLIYEILVRWISPNEKISVKTSKGDTPIKTAISEISIPDLDIISGIRRFGDNEDLYMKMLNKFISSNNNTCKELKEFVLQSEYEKAHLKIHTLKGESANIGADKIQLLSKQVEKAVLAKDIILFEKELLILENNLKELTTELQCYFKEIPCTTKKDISALKILINELTECLKVRDPKAFDLLDKLNENDIKKSDLTEINKAVNSGNLEEAFALLKKLSEVSE